MDLFNPTFLASMLGIFASFATFMFNQFRERKRKNAELLFKYRDNFRTSENFSKIMEIIYDDKREDLAKGEHVNEMAAFLEEIALLVQSNLMSLELANYFFGWYVIQLIENERVKRANPLEEKHWPLLYLFARRIEPEQERLKKDPTLYISKLKI